MIDESCPGRWLPRLLFCKIMVSRCNPVLERSQMKPSPLKDRDRNRRRALILIWLFPVLILALLTAMATRISEEQALRRLLSAWGVDESVLKNPDVQTLIERARTSGFYASLQPPPPHEHPLPDRFSVQASGFDLVFPHFGDGELGAGRRLQSTWTLANFSFQPLAGTLEIYDSEGNLQELTVNDQTGSAFDFELAPNAVTSYHDFGDRSH